jgi:hypothetical protein
MIQRHTSAIALGAISILFLVQSIIGITWGLPSRDIDRFLFPEGDVWSGEAIYRLAGAEGKFSPMRGADVDADALQPPATLPSPQPSAVRGEASPRAAIPLTATDEDVAKILLRYRLYTYQPDEMITMMALAGMRPGKLEFDPRLYQYGGLFIYPVGALIKLCGVLGLIKVRGDVSFYLDHPDEFGKFYVVARAYSSAWGLLGVFVVYVIARRLVPRAGSSVAGLLAALFFALMPVVVCMSHEGKPHLAGAVLMLGAVYFAMRYCETPSMPCYFAWMCVACGAALGMVLSSWPVLMLIPIVARLQVASPTKRWGHSALLTSWGGALAIVVYLVTNPYVALNALLNRDVLASNFGNSLAMYEISRVGEGLLRVTALTVEGATLPVLILGGMALVRALLYRRAQKAPLVLVAAVFFLQFVLVGAGKPAEYGRFGIFTNTALAIGAAWVVTSLAWRWPRRVAVTLVTLWIGYSGAMYLQNFWADARGRGSRIELAEYVRAHLPNLPHGAAFQILVPKEPAPYNMPPIAFRDARLVLVPPGAQVNEREGSWWRLQPVDSVGDVGPSSDGLKFVPFTPDIGKETAISWANKPFAIESGVPAGSRENRGPEGRR